MDLTKAKKLGELVKEIEELQLSLGVVNSGLENNAWVIEIRATDEGECERSFKFPLPPHKSLVQDIMYTKEYLKSLDEAGKPRPTMEYRSIRQRAISDGRRIFEVVKDIIESQLADKKSEMDNL